MGRDEKWYDMDKAPFYGRVCPGGYNRLGVVGQNKMGTVAGDCFASSVRGQAAINYPGHAVAVVNLG